MEFCKFIECRIGEPITSLDVQNNHVLFGSISGYFGIYDVSNDVVCFSEECEKYLIRSCCLDINTKRKFKNPNEKLEKDSIYDNYIIEEESVNSENIFNEGGKSDIFKEAAELKFEYDEGNYNLAYLGVGDSSILRVDIDRFMKERSKAISQQTDPTKLSNLLTT